MSLDPSDGESVTILVWVKVMVEKGNWKGLKSGDVQSLGIGIKLHF